MGVDFFVSRETVPAGTGIVESSPVHFKIAAVMQHQFGDQGGRTYMKARYGEQGPRYDRFPL